MITHEEYRNGLKNHICSMLSELYIRYNGQAPNYEEEEEVCVEVREITKRQLYINVEVCNIYNGSTHTEKQELVNMVATLDGNLFFRHGDYEQETEWTEISTDELASIRDILRTALQTS